MKILAIESSCDETAAAVISEIDNKPTILSNEISSQIDIHSKYGGVVPEVAARAHIENVLPIIQEALTTAKTTLDEIDYLAVTYGPGLIGSLVVGVETAKGLSIALDKPLVPVNHLEGHIYASFASKTPDAIDQTSNIEPQFPILTLMVSGGNTLLVLIKSHLNYEVVGQTLDDAAGEAFDKGAKLLDLGYPGGPIISKLAAKGDPSKYNLPVIDLTPAPKRNQNGFMEAPEPSLNFSFSGLKTALLTITKSEGPFDADEKNNLCASYQNAIVDTLVQNSIRAVTKYQPKTFVLAGGVAANPLLRERLKEAIYMIDPKVDYRIPPFSLCGDNAAMIGVAAYYRLKNSKEKLSKPSNLTAIPNLKIA